MMNSFVPGPVNTTALKCRNPGARWRGTIKPSHIVTAVHSRLVSNHPRAGARARIFY